MHCSHLVEEETPDHHPQCRATIIPFEPSPKDQEEFCRTTRYRQCPLYKNATRELNRAIHREVARALG
jgi:hypothetical protein